MRNGECGMRSEKEQEGRNPCRSPFHSAFCIPHSALLFSAALLLALACCTKQQAGPAPEPDPQHPGRFVLRFEAMGTDATLTVRAPDAGAARRMTAPAVSRIEQVEALMSTYRPESEISRLNAHGAQEAVKLSPETMRVLRESVRFGRLSDGAFDVAYAPLRALWRKAQERGALPTQEELQDTLKRVGSDKLILTGDSARFSVAGMEVDLGGIAKGYAIDLAAEAMKKAGAESGIVDLGGNMFLIGRRGDSQKWQVQVRDPRKGEHAPIYLRLENVAVSTSGDYARFFRVGEKTYSHIVDPHTGWPVSAIPSATVVAPDATTADALSTAISVLGAARGIELIDSLDGMACMIMARAEGAEKVEEEVSIHYSRGFRELMEEPNAD